MLSRTPGSAGPTEGARRPAPRQASGTADASVNLGRYGVWHPIDLPEGYHPVPPGASMASSTRGEAGCCPRGHRVVGLHQADGMPLRSSVHDP